MNKKLLKRNQILCMVVLLWTAFWLFGCGSKGTKAEQAGISETAAAFSESGSQTPEEATEKYAPLSEQGQQETIIFLESFEPEISFIDMDSELAEMYGGPLKDYYSFRGRISEDGSGYVLGFRTSSEDVLNGLSIYWVDGYARADAWNEQKEEYEAVYTFGQVENIVCGEDRDILYLQPADMETPEELERVFDFQYCDGENGREYLRDVISRGVRLTPPDLGAYLAVSRFEDGVRRSEYVELTQEQEMEILYSDMAVLPEEYGYDGIQFVVSQEAYENGAPDEGPITFPALEIAKEKCRFEVVSQSEIYDLVKAKFIWADEATSGDSTDEELTDPEDLKELESILTEAESSTEGKCPYTGILTLTRKDGREIKVSVAMDSCGNFVLGSKSTYSLDQGQLERFWALFPDMKAEKEKKLN